MAETMIQEMQERADKMKQNGDHLNALKCMEKLLLLHQETHGYKSLQVKTASIETGEYCNMLAMKCLQEENFSVCQKLLKKASSLAVFSTALQVATYNNFACLFRKQDKLRLALDFLMKAIDLEATLDQAPAAAETHLNACAVLSQLGRHSKALEHAQAALILLQESNIPTNDKEETTLDEDRAVVLSVAHHNIGVEYEYLGQLSQSLTAYRKAVKVATENLGSSHSITESLSKALEVATETASNSKPQPQKSKSSPKKKPIASKKTIQCYGKAEVLIEQKTDHERVEGRQSPTKRDAKRFDCAYSAYGRIPGVTPVKAGKITRKLLPKGLDVKNFDADVLDNSFV